MWAGTCDEGDVGDVSQRGCELHGATVEAAGVGVGSEEKGLAVVEKASMCVPHAEKGTAHTYTHRHTQAHTRTGIHRLGPHLLALRLKLPALWAAFCGCFTPACDEEERALALLQDHGAFGVDEWTRGGGSGQAAFHKRNERLEFTRLAVERHMLPV